MCSQSSCLLLAPPDGASSPRRAEGGGQASSQAGQPGMAQSPVPAGRGLPQSQAWETNGLFSLCFLARITVLTLEAQEPLPGSHHLGSGGSSNVSPFLCPFLVPWIKTK